MRTLPGARYAMKKRGSFGAEGAARFSVALRFPGRRVGRAAFSVAPRMGSLEGIAAGVTPVFAHARARHALPCGRNVAQACAGMHSGSGYPWTRRANAMGGWDSGLFRKSEVSTDARVVAMRNLQSYGDLLEYMANRLTWEWLTHLPIYAIIRCRVIRMFTERGQGAVPVRRSAQSGPDKRRPRRRGDATCAP